MLDEKNFEENQKAIKNFREMEENYCRNRLNTGFGCGENCKFFHTTKCVHPEKAFNSQVIF